MKMEKLAQIKERLKQTEAGRLPEVLKSYQEDERAGVKKLVAQYQKKYDALLAEKERLKKMHEYENAYGDKQYICGIDEVGRGPFAGPVVACAVVLPKEDGILYLNDSKKLSEKMRKKLCEEIKEKAVAIGIGMAGQERIDEVNILNATYEAMREAIRNLSVTPDVLLNDAVTIPGVDILQVPIIKGDQKSLSISAASIVAKVTRDEMMEEYAKAYPVYGFEKNKGYGTAEHIEAIRRYGLCELHRRSFVKNIQ